MGDPRLGSSYAAQFVARRDSGCNVVTERGVEGLAVHSPNQLANFVAFCKARGRRVYFRGQNLLHDTVQPSLARASGKTDAKWRAYTRFVRELPAIVTGTRFRRRDLGAVLQHYGYRTPWLDVVDDLHTAVWFALHSVSNQGGLCSYSRIPTEHAWVLLLSVPRSVKRQDLRESHSSRNARCHAQQGWSLAMQHDSDRQIHPSQDFSHFVIARVRIPNAPKWHLDGFMASQVFLFPPAELDETYAQLQMPGISDLAGRIESEEGLLRGSLGRTAVYYGPEHHHPAV